jgi:hypothetical protein
MFTMPFEEAAALTFGTIVLVPFPFTDQTASKQRPAVVVSTDAYNAARPDTILMAITSQLRASSAGGGAYGEVTSSSANSEPWLIQMPKRSALQSRRSSNDGIKTFCD